MFPSWSLETTVTSKIGRGLHQPIYNFSLTNEVIIVAVLKYQISACYFSFNYVAFPLKAEYFRNTKYNHFVKQYFYLNICNSELLDEIALFVFNKQAHL